MIDGGIGGPEYRRIFNAMPEQTFPRIRSTCESSAQQTAWFLALQCGEFFVLEVAGARQNLQNLRVCCAAPGGAQKQLFARPGDATAAATGRAKTAAPNVAGSIPAVLATARGPPPNRPPRRCRRPAEESPAHSEADTARSEVSSRGRSDRAGVEPTRAAIHQSRRRRRMSSEDTWSIVRNADRCAVPCKRGHRETGQDGSPILATSLAA